MLIAGAVYLVIDNLSTSSLSGLLVDTVTISENAGQIRVNDKNISDSDLRRLQTNARILTSQMESESSSSQNVMVANTENRRADRMLRFAADGQPVHAAAPMQMETVEHAGAPLQTGSFVEETAPAPVVTTSVVPDETATALPSSGMGTVGLIALASLGAVMLRKRVHA